MNRQQVSEEVASAYPERVIGPEQIRGARGMLGWTQSKLAHEAKVPLSALKAIESGRDARIFVLAAIEKTLVEAGILFLEPNDVRGGGRGLRFTEDR